MSDILPVTVCSATFGPGQGSVVPHFLKSLSVRSRPSLCVYPNVLYSDNLTPDNKYLHRSYIHGDEIGLQWDSVIPVEQRNICLSFDLKELKKKVTRILKKDQASLFIVQNRTKTNHDRFSGEGSSDNFTIFIGRGTNEREGLQSVPALRIKFSASAVIEPQDTVKLAIPVRVFREMMASFNKCKPDDRVKITFFDISESQPTAGILITSKSNLNTGTIIEKYGTIPEDHNDLSGISSLNVGTLNDGLEKLALVHSQPKVQLVLVDPSQISFQPNEFVIDPDKSSHFVSFASLHNEGTVRIYYTPGSDLKFGFRFGPYGEQIVYLNSRVG
jgi:hypothetical protein